MLEDVHYTICMKNVIHCWSELLLWPGLSFIFPVTQFLEQSVERVFVFILAICYLSLCVLICQLLGLNGQWTVCLCLIFRIFLFFQQIWKIIFLVEAEVAVDKTSADGNLQVRKSYQNDDKEYKVWPVTISCVLGAAGSF